MTTFPDIWTALGAPFAANQERHRQQAGRDLVYITARTVMNRLDEVLGPENWTAVFTPWGQDAVACALTVTLPDGRQVTKHDVGACSQLAERTKGADPGEDDKGGVADALKRAAVQFGVGRYLYGDGTPQFGAAREPGEDLVEPAHQPAAARNGAAPRRRESQWGSADRGEAVRRTEPDAPRTGKALFAWAKEQDEQTGADRNGWLNYLSGWGKRQDYPGRIVDWNEGQTRAAWDEVRRRSAAVEESDRFQRQAIG